MCERASSHGPPTPGDGRSVVARAVTADHSLLDALNPQQREAVLHTEGPLLVVAGAGSGKTRVLTHRVAHLIAACGVKPNEILAITFTNKAAGEMRSRLEGLLGGVARAIWILTFHSACGRILRRGGAPARGPEEYRSRVASFYDQTVADAYELYQRRLFGSNAVDFDDLLMLTVDVLERFPEAREKWQKAFRYILVDEYQDTNHAQYVLLKLLGEQHRNVCAVGDPDQSIYAFRGADIRNILEFERDFPGTRTIALEQNYRSTNAILNAANHVISQNRERKEKNLWSELGEGDAVQVVEVEDEHAEARFVAASIAQLVEEGYAGSEIAVVYRTNAQSRVLEDVLVRQGVPYQVIGGPKFYERAEIKDAIAYLQVLDNPADAVSLQRIANRPRRGIGDTSLSRLQTFAEGQGITLFEALSHAEQAGLATAPLRAVQALRALLERLRDRVGRPVFEVAEAVLEESGYLAGLEAERTIEAQGRIENLQELVGVAREYQQRSAEPT